VKAKSWRVYQRFEQNFSIFLDFVCIFLTLQGFVGFVHWSGQNDIEKYYGAFHRFGQAKFPDGGLVLG